MIKSNSLSRPILSKISKLSRVVPLIGLLALSACAAPTPGSVNVDPNEANNRQVHKFNQDLDRVLLKPASDIYGNGMPVPLQRGVSNFASNLDLPGDVVNNLLQGRPGFAMQNSFRFLVNSTVGIAGLFDVATLIDAPQKKTDFGETLHVWGVGEGAYVELPVFGPSTERDMVGTIVDIAANPVGALFPNAPTYLGTVAKVGSKLGDRHRYSNTIDSVLHDSADSYSQTRLLYLQNRRFELGQSNDAETDFLDPYEDSYAE